MTIEVRQIREEDIESFHAAIDAVARERKYLALFEAPPIERARAFVQRNIERAIRNSSPSPIGRSLAGATYHRRLAR